MTYRGTLLLLLPSRKKKKKILLPHLQSMVVDWSRAFKGAIVVSALDHASDPPRPCSVVNYQGKL